MITRFKIPIPRPTRITAMSQPSVSMPPVPPCIEVEILEHDEAKHEITLRATLDVGGYAYRTHVLVVVDEIASNYDHLRDLLLHELSQALELVR